MLFMQLVFSEGHVVADFVKQAGGSERDQMIATAVIQGIVMIAATIALTVLTLGAGAEGIVASVLSTVGKIADVLSISEKTVQITFMVVQCVIAALQVANQGIEINNDVLMSQIDLIKGRSDAQSEQIQAIIDMLRMLIKKLLDMLAGGGDDLVNIQKLQADKYNKFSQITDGLTGSISY